MLIIRQEQMAVLHEYQRRQFVTSAVQRIRAGFREKTMDRTDDHINATVEKGIALAKDYGILGETDTMRFLMFWYPLESKLLDDPQFSWARGILTDGSLTETDKMDAIDFHELFHLTALSPTTDPP